MPSPATAAISQPATVLVTGAFGNLGQMVLATLRERGYHVIAMDLDTPRNRKCAASIANTFDEVIWGDIRHLDFSPLICRVSTIIHLAALLPPATETAAALAEAINVGATVKIIDAIAAAPQKPLLVFPSSVTVFGLPQSDLPKPQGPAQRTIHDPIAATDNYTRHKITIENHLRNSSIPYAILRVGVSVDARTLAADVGTLKKLLKVAPDNPLEYIHPIDVATAFVNCIDNPEAIGKVFLLGGGANCRITQHQFIGAALEAAGITLPRELMGSDPFYTHWMDTAESNRVLNFQQHSFDDYKNEMRARLRFVRPLVTPLAPLAITFLRRWLRD